VWNQVLCGSLGLWQVPAREQVKVAASTASICYMRTSMQGVTAVGVTGADLGGDDRAAKQR
jgi:hypothetical protein